MSNQIKKDCEYCGGTGRNGFNAARQCYNACVKCGGAGQTVIHRFEEAGLGIAPFKLVAVERRVHRLAPDVFMCGAACDYCSTGIVECCIIRDANGKTFIVGNECVRHTGDAGLIDTVKRALNEVRREHRHEKEAIRIAEGKAKLSDPRVELALRKEPHPYQHQTAKGLSAFNYVCWMLENAGNKGKIEATRTIEKVFDAVQTMTAPDAEKQIAELKEKDDEQARAAALEIERVEQARLEAENAATLKYSEENADIIAVLEREFQGDFIKSMLELLRLKSFCQFSDKQYRIIKDIFAKSFGRRGSKAYIAAEKKIENLYYPEPPF